MRSQFVSSSVFESVHLTQQQLHHRYRPHPTLSPIFLSFVMIKSDDGTGLQAPSPGQVADELSDIAPRDLFDAA